MRFLGAFLLLSLITGSAAHDGDGGLYARHAAPIWSGGERTIFSPDGRKAIVVRSTRDKYSDEIHIVSVRVNKKEFPTEIGLLVNAEALWSPDSSAFFLNYSDGGNIGTYHLKVFYVSGAGLRVVEPIPNGRGLFAPWCFSDEYPNVAGIRWVARDHSRILLAVQVPPHSSCASMGTFRAFEIALPNGTVIKRYGQLRAKETFTESLGIRLKEADDSCVLKPATCVPPGLKKR